MRSATLAVGVFLAALTVSPALALDEVNTLEMRSAVSVGRILKHERAFQMIANQYGGTRASGTEGYEASAEYVFKRLEKAGYEPAVQPFLFNWFEEISPPQLNQIEPNTKQYGSDAISTLTYSGSGDVIATVQSVNITIPPTPSPSSQSGCKADDFKEFKQGNIALVQRGGCLFETKAKNATTAGAVAILIFNEGQPGNEDRTGVIHGGLSTPASIPVLGTTFAIGEELYALLQAGKEVKLHLIANNVSEVRSTSNIIASTKKGDADSAIVIGSHLDSVTAGPGINDNGSGAATNLELAIQVAKHKIEPVHQLRFAFWGAEEFGLVGSERYVQFLGPNGIGGIYANLNFDMLASPNFGRFVMGGGGEVTAPGTDEITAMFQRYFASQGLATDISELDNRSDYAPFAEAGVPVGGLVTGAEGIMTEAQAKLFGVGKSGVAFDICYHKACDSMTNLNTQALREMAAGAVHGVMTLGLSSEELHSDHARKPKLPSEMSHAGGERLLR